MFGQDEYYAWLYEGSQWTTYAGGLAMVALILGGVMFPLWPPIMRLGVWYLSIGMLSLVGLFFAIAIVRLIFYIITVVVASPGIWIFPKLFADVGFVRFHLSLSHLSLVHGWHAFRWSHSSRYGSGISQQRSRRRRKLLRGKRGTRLLVQRDLVTTGQMLKSQMLRRIHVPTAGRREWKKSRMRMRLVSLALRYFHLRCCSYHLWSRGKTVSLFGERIRAGLLIQRA
jgi:hypothetical protein